MSYVAGEIPPGWVEIPLDEVLAPLDDGRTLHHGWSPQCAAESSASDDVWGVLKTTAVQDGQFLPQHNKLLPSPLRPRQNLEVKEGDILLTCAGPRSRCGIACLVRKTRPRLIFSGKMYRFRGEERLLDPRFLEAFLQRPMTKAAIDAMKTGISDSGLNLTHDRFRQLLVRLAPRRQQEAIADRIDELFTALAAGVAALERVRKKLKRYRSAVLHAAVTGRLTAAWRKTHGPPAETGEQLLARILVERRRQWEERTLAKYAKDARTPPKNWESRYPTPATSRAPDSSELPQGWTWGVLDQMFTKVSNGTAIAPHASTGVPILRISAVRPLQVDTHDIRYLLEDEARTANAWVNTDDLLFTRYNGSARYCGVCGRVGQFNGKLAHPDKLICCTIVAVGVNSKFIEIAANAGITRSHIEGCLRTTAGQVGVSGSDIKNAPIPIPPDTEQNAIAEAINEKLSQIAAMEAEVERGLARASRLRQAILKAAFDGKLVAQDPADESAERLLERIKGEREAEGPSRPQRRRRTPMVASNG